MGKNNQKVGVYSLRGIEGKSAIKIEHLETANITAEHKLMDTSIHKYNITQFIDGEIYTCNLTDSRLMASRKQPVINAVIALTKPLKACILCNIYLYFTITEDVKTAEQFLNSDLNGNFTLEIVIQGVPKQLDQEINIFPGNNRIVEMIVGLTKTDVMIEVLKELAYMEEEKIASKYDADFDFNIPEKYISLKDYDIEQEYDEISDDDYTESEEDTQHKDIMGD